MDETDILQTPKKDDSMYRKLIQVKFKSINIQEINIKFPLHLTQLKRFLVDNKSHLFKSNVYDNVSNIS